MAKQWKHTFSKFYNGETDDTFIPTGDKYLSSYNIEPVLNPRYLELSYLVTTTASISVASDITSITELPSFNTIYLGSSNVFYNTTSKTSTVAGTNYQKCSYLYNTSGLLKVYIFDATNVIRMNSDLTTKEASTAHASGDVTSVAQASNTIVFSVGNIIYQVDNSGVITTVLSTIPYGSIVKGMYYYNDMLYIFTNLGADSIIYQCTYNGSNYSINYKHSIKGISIRDIAGNGGDIYFVASQIGTVSGRGLYKTSGIDSKKIKSIPITSSARCSFINSDYLAIIDGTNYYRYGANIPGFPKAFVKLITHSTTFTAISSDYLTTSLSGGNVAQCSVSGTFFQGTGEIVTMPYDSGVLWAEKNLDVIDFPYELKTGKTGASIQIQIQTNLMELDNPTTYINIKTLSDLSNSTMRCRIDRQEILTALSSENPNWQYARFKIILNGGLPDGSSRMQYSPKVYQDILIAGEFINDAETYL